MIKWLASVQSVDEANSVLPILPDILDMKNPSLGALGALPVDTVSEIVELIKGQCQTSATIGDLEMNAKIIGPAMVAMAASGVDYVKMGLFPDKNLSQCLVNLSVSIKELNTPVIGVIFADHPVNIEIHTLLAKSGFKGVMIDTAMKDGKHLLDHMDKVELAEFVAEAKKNNLLCGLAGALRNEDISVLADLDADYLGFRSALCEQRQRKAIINVASVEAIKVAMAQIN
ncbi:(5-formylfuran-3-yl)methyl phosphate synthase [Pseudomonadota bacterium]|nr:(5-formylfuran-3-yl)methyl phosphate synthase [Pseudomonadota bacterium]